MAKANKTNTDPVAQNAALDANAGNGEGGGDGTAVATVKNKGGRKRGPSNPDTTLYFNGERDAALASLILSANGQLTSAAVGARLAQHPAYADQKALLETGTKNESIRQRVIKLNKRAQALGLGELSLKRTANTGYDADEVLRQVFAGKGQGQGTMGVYQSQGQGQPPVPTQGSGNPIVGGFTGGLIPTA